MKYKYLFCIFLIFFSNVFLLISEEKFEKKEMPKEYIDSDLQLRNMTFDSEIFIPEVRGTETILINSFENKAVRDFFDENNRLVKKEVWEISDVKSSYPVQIIYFKYSDSGLLVSKNILKDDMEEHVEYDSEGLPVLLEEFNFAEVTKNDKTENIKYKVHSESWKYDKEKRIESFEKKIFEYGNENYKKPIKSFLEEKKYFYHEDSEIPADQEIYENGNLQKKIIYSTKTNYITELFFESDYVVKTFYQDDRRVRDEYFLDGKLLRSKDYE